MSATTSIEWTDRTWNPVRGCSVVSAGCKNCYAMSVAARFSGPGQAYEGLALRSPARWTGEVRVVGDALTEPLSWRKPCRVFVNSMSDLFHEALSDDDIERVFGVMALCPHLTFQVLTKRGDRMLQWFTTMGGLETRENCVMRSAEFRGHRRWGSDGAPFVFDPRGSEHHRYPGRITAANVANRRPWPGWPLPNVWLGVSVEDQRAADERIPLLLQTPAAVRFLSVEPLLGPVNLMAAMPPTPDGPYRLHGLHWVIVGGESGPKARPCDVCWIRSVVAQCREAGVPCFVKQLGARPFGWDGVRVLGDRKGGDPLEWPADLRVREFPEARR